MTLSIFFSTIIEQTDQFSSMSTSTWSMMSFSRKSVTCEPQNYLKYNLNYPKLYKLFLFIYLLHELSQTLSLSLYIYIYIHTHIHIYIYAYNRNPVKIAHGNNIFQKAPFSIATTPRSRERRYSFPWIAPLYPWDVPKAVSSTIF